MSRNTYTKSNTANFIPIFFLIAYLCIGFIPNWQAVDKIAPQWLLMSILNLTCLIYLIYFRQHFSERIIQTINTALSYTYIAFISWAALSYFYAINSTEVLVNITRQVNVLAMYIMMGIFIYNIKEKNRLISYIISVILIIEVYAVLEEALKMINSSGLIVPSELKGVTANRNITAFSIAIKIPFVLFLIYKFNKFKFKIVLSGVIFFSILCLSMIQSRASFLAMGLALILYLGLCVVLYLKNKNRKHLLSFGYLLIPFLLAIITNQVYLSDKGSDAIARATTITAGVSDDSVNQRLRYYEDVLTHISSNFIFGVGLGNWKIKSIDYDSKDISGYVVPYHAHSDFIQLGAELGIIGFLLYLGVFIWATYFVFFIIKYSSISIEEKVFLYLILVALAIYSVDANLNFPIARPQVLVVWAIIIALINFYYKKNFKSQKNLSKRSLQIYSFLGIGLISLVPSVYVTNSVYKSLKGQMFLLQDFNSNQFNVPINQVDNIVPDIPNISVTTLPLNSVKARYYLNAKKYDKAISLVENGTSANPYLFYSELLKSQIFTAKGKIDSAKFYAKKAFFGLPNNPLHTANYINLVNRTGDRIALEEMFDLLTEKNNIDNWRNYLIVANRLSSIKKERQIIKRAEKASKLFPYDQQIQNLYRSIAVGQVNAESAVGFSDQGLIYFNKGDFQKAAIEFEKAIEKNPLEYSYFENSATANYMSGNLSKALDQINVVINDLNPLNGKCEYVKALIFIRMGDQIGACPLLETSLKSGFTDAEVLFNQYCSNF